MTHKPLWKFLMTEQPSILKMLNREQIHQLEAQMMDDMKKDSSGMTRRRKARILGTKY